MIFYLPYSIYNRPLSVAERVFLPEEESQHAVKVLRLQAGDAVEIVDGKGNFYTAGISSPHSKRCEVEITNVSADCGKRDFYLHIAIAPTKNIERLEWFVEKAVEIGIDEISPLLCRHSERKILKSERLEKIAVSAMKQSKKACLPQLNPLLDFAQFIGKNADAQKFIAHCYRNEKKLLQELYIPQNGKVVVLIGPEGDFSEEEVTKALQQGFQPVSLGESRLRTETAGLVACHTVHLLEERRFTLSL